LKIFRIDITYACFGIDVENDIVVDAAPIGKWMIGKNISFITNWVKKKNGVIHEIL